MSAITASVDKVKGLVDEVSSSTQAGGRHRSGRGSGLQIEKVTQQTAATAEESAAASEELNAQAETAMVVVGRLAALVEPARAAVAGTTAKARPRRARPWRGPEAAPRATPVPRRNRRSGRSPLRRAS